MRIIAIRTDIRTVTTEGHAHAHDPQWHNKSSKFTKIFFSSMTRKITVQKRADKFIKKSIREKKDKQFFK